MMTVVKIVFQLVGLIPMNVFPEGLPSHQRKENDTFMPVKATLIRLFVKLPNFGRAVGSWLLNKTDFTHLSQVTADRSSSLM